MFFLSIILYIYITAHCFKFTKDCINKRYSTKKKGFLNPFSIRMLNPIVRKRSTFYCYNTPHDLKFKKPTHLIAASILINHTHYSRLINFRRKQRMFTKNRHSSLLINEIDLNLLDKKIISDSAVRSLDDDRIYDGKEILCVKSNLLQDENVEKIKLMTDKMSKMKIVSRVPF